MVATLAGTSELPRAEARRTGWSPYAAMIGLALLGCVVSGSLVLLEQGSIAEGAGLCGGERFDCGAVASSRYSEIFGLSLSVVGLGFYLVILLLSGLAALRRSSRDQAWVRELVHWVLSMAILALLVDAYLLGTMVFELKAICSLCLATYAINGALGATAYRVVCTGSPSRASRLKWIGMALLAAATFALSGARSGWSSTDEVRGVSPLMVESALESDDLSQSVLEALIGHGPPIRRPDLYEGPSKGVDDAPYQVAIFGDFQCPYCRQLAEITDQLMAEQPGQVRVVFKHFPLSETCNPYVASEMHGEACLRSAAAIAAGVGENDGGFWKMHDLLFLEERSLEVEGLAKMAAGLGHAPDEFQASLGSRAVREQIASDVELGQSIGVRAIPAVFVNGLRVPDYRLLHPELFAVLTGAMAELQL